MHQWDEPECVSYPEVHSRYRTGMGLRHAAGEKNRPAAEKAPQQVWNRWSYCSSAGDSFWIRKIMRNKLDSSFGLFTTTIFIRKSSFHVWAAMRCTAPFSGNAFVPVYSLPEKKVQKAARTCFFLCPDGCVSCSIFSAFACFVVSQRQRCAFLRIAFRRGTAVKMVFHSTRFLLLPFVLFFRQHCTKPA